MLLKARGSRRIASLATLSLVGLLLGGLLSAFTCGVIVFVDAADATGTTGGNGGGAQVQYVTGGAQKFFEPPDIEIEESAVKTVHKTTLADSSIGGVLVGAGGTAQAGAGAAAGGAAASGQQEAQRQQEEEDRLKSQDPYLWSLYKQYQEYEQQKTEPTPTYKYIEPMQRSTPPRLCSDGHTYGYSDLNSLRLAINEANKHSDESFVQLSQYYAAYEQFERNPGEYEEPIPPEIPVPDPFIICPGITLKSRRSLTATEINAEDVVIVCDSCTIDAPGTHLTFGSKARNVLIRGITFKSATTSSLTFHQHGALVEFEDCFWAGNSGSHVSVGAIADLNSTSSVSFYRCEISDTKQMTTRTAGGQVQQVSSSLTIRN